MDPLALLIGLFFFAAIYKNKDLSENLNGTPGSLLTIFMVVLLLGGLGFILNGRVGASPNMSLAFPIMIGFIVVMVSTKGDIKLVSQLGAIALFVLIITNSFMFF